MSSRLRRSLSDLFDRWLVFTAVHSWLDDYLGGRRRWRLLCALLFVGAAVLPASCPGGDCEVQADCASDEDCKWVGSRRTNSRCRTDADCGSSELCHSGGEEGVCYSTVKQCVPIEGRTARPGDTVRGWTVEENTRTQLRVRRSAR